MNFAIGLVGLLAVLAAVLSKLLRGRPFSMPLVFLVLGFAVALLPVELPWEAFDQQRALRAVELFTELTVVVSLAGAGLKLNRRVGLRSWSSTWRLLGLTLPLSVLAVAMLGYHVLGLSAAGALLLGAILSPTDPVLAAEVQEPGPDEAGRGGDSEVRTTLTSEAGINDGLAMPFVLAALALHGGGLGGPGPVFGFVGAMVWQIVLGIVVGILCGAVLSWLFFRSPPGSLRLGESSDGFVVLGLAFVPFALAEIAGGLGFVATFAAAYRVGVAERQHGYHRVLHDFGEQLERLLVAVALLGVGLVAGSGLLPGLRIREVAVAVLLTLVVRPVLGWVALLGGTARGAGGAAVSFFGIRGVGSLFYLTFALAHASFPRSDVLWHTVLLAVMVSVLVHGVSATPVMRRLDLWGNQRT